MRVEIKEVKLFNKMINNIYKTKNKKINGITIDSRKIHRGDIYIPIKGNNIDGHHFIDDAQKKGAGLIFSEYDNNNNNNIISVESTLNTLINLAIEWRKYFTGKIIGVTGSNGKTTIKELLYHVLSNQHKCECSIDNHNNKIGIPLSIFSMDPFSEIVILEMGTSAPGELQQLCNMINPDIGIITNISESHLESFKNVNNIAIEKSSLFDSLSNDGIAFVNMDDAFISHMSTNALINDNKIKIPYGGKAMAENVIATFSICSYLGLTYSKTIELIESFNAPKGRGKIYFSNQYTIIDDCYNANPVSIKEGIKRLALYDTKYRRIAVIGDMLELGDNSKELHSQIGFYITEFYIDAIFTYGNHSKNINKILISKGYKSWHFINQDTLLENLLEYLNPNDVIYFKGSRGMHLEKIISGIT